MRIKFIEEEIEQHPRFSFKLFFSNYSHHQKFPETIDSYIEEKEEIERSQNYQMFYENSIIVQKKLQKFLLPNGVKKNFLTQLHRSGKRKRGNINLETSLQIKLELFFSNRFAKLLIRNYFIQIKREKIQNLNFLLPLSPFQ